jgi:hypothetical protein
MPARDEIEGVFHADFFRLAHAASMDFGARVSSQA